MHLDDVWIMIEGHNMNARAEMERLRVGWYYVAAFGNSDKRKLPRSLQKFHPFEWDEVEQKLTAKELKEQIEWKKQRLLELQKSKDGSRGNTQSQDSR